MGLDERQQPFPVHPFHLEYRVPPALNKHTFGQVLEADLPRTGNCLEGLTDLLVTPSLVLDVTGEAFHRPTAAVCAVDSEHAREVSADRFWHAQRVKHPL